MSRSGIQFIVLVILARLLDPSDFGLVAMVLVFTAIGTILVDSGFSTALIQRQQTSPDDETTVFCFSIIAGMFLASLLWWSAPHIAQFYSQPSLVPLIRVMAVVLPLHALASVPDALLALKLDFRTRARAELLASSTAGTFAVLLALQGFGVWSLIGQAIVLVALRSTLLWAYTGWRPRGQISSQSFRVLFAFGGFILMSRLLDTVSIRLQSLLIGRLFDSRTLGMYTLAQNTQEAPASFFAALLNRVGLPVFSATAKDPVRLRDALKLSLRASMFLFVPGMTGIAVLAGPLMVGLYGARWIDAAPILSILAMSAVFWPLHVLNLSALAAMGYSNLYFRLTVIKKIILIVLIVALSPWGPIGIASGVLASSLISVILNTIYTGKFLDFGLYQQLKALASIFSLSAFAAMVAFLVMLVMKPGLGGLMTAVTLAALAYTSGALLIKHSAIDTIFSLSKSLLESEGRKQ